MHELAQYMLKEENFDTPMCRLNYQQWLIPSEVPFKGMDTINCYRNTEPVHKWSMDLLQV